MDNRERFLTALRLGQPDRVPYFDFFDEASIANTAKALFEIEVAKPKTVVDHTFSDDTYTSYDLLFEIIRKLDIDALIAWSLTGSERIEGKQNLIRDVYGIVYKMTKVGSPVPVEGPVKDTNDLKKIAVMKPNHADFALLEYVKKGLPERVLIFSPADTFRLSWYLMGATEKLLPLYVTDPDFCLKLARTATDLLKQEIEMAIDKGAEVILQEGDLAFGRNTFMSRDHYRRFIKPFHHEMCETAHERGVPIIKHSDGNIWAILDDLIEAGYDGIHPIEPQSMDIKRVKEHLNGRACVMGNIDCTYLLPGGTKQEVIESVKETIGKVAPDGGYILTSSNSIHPGCKGQNTVAMFEAAKRYGLYPIKVD
jgi:uroporphyrinogen decarboxylase